MERAQFRSFAMKLLVASALIALGGLFAFIRNRDGLPDTLVVVLFLAQLLFAFAGSTLFVWAIGSVVWGDLKRLVDWTSRN